jgi:Kef-type K+ transport system membrane component KefB
MNSLSTHELCVFLVGLGVLLGSARFLGELARRFGQPAILGEIITGIVLGPTLLGSLAPSVYSFLFPRSGGVAMVMDGLTTLAIVMFLLVTGMKVDLSTVWRQGRSGMAVSAFGMVIPFAIGFATAWFAPGLLGGDRGAQPVVLPLFFGTALCISALPVVARILMDLNLYRSKVGAIILTAAVFDDLVGWLVFGVVLGMVGGGGFSGTGLGWTIGFVLGFAVIMMTAGRWLVDRLLHWVQTHASLPGTALALAATLGLFSAACTEWIGIHAIFGAFILGVALGDSRHLRKKTRGTMHEFISYVLAPLFFASVGLKVDFVANFDGFIALVVLLVATLGKVLACRMAARWSGLASCEAWAIGFGLNARGAMDIILSMLALRAGIIQEKLFVAIVIMALVTSMTSGTLIKRVLRLKEDARSTDGPRSKAFGSPSGIGDLPDPIFELARMACNDHELDRQPVGDEVEMSVRE